MLSASLIRPNLFLVDENTRGSTVLLSAHCQGFCRDLHAESSLIIAAGVRLSLRTVAQTQFFANCALDHGNPNLANIKKDFNRLGFLPDLAATPANLPRLSHLA